MLKRNCNRFFEGDYYMSFEKETIEKRIEGARLTTLVKLYQKYQPLLDEQVLLAGVIIVLRDNGFKINKKEIYYAFKKNYNKELNGDVQSYTTWLYSLASKKTSNNSISGTNKARSSKKNKERLDCKGNAQEGLE